MPETSRPRVQSGFSLVELIVAMAVTLVVTGAVYGLMSGGNNAFRREPELTDRQQNARIAMDMIQKDISNAGVNMGPFFQTFSRGLNAVGRITGPTSSQVADHLEVFGNDGTCPDAPTIPTNPTNGANINVRGGVPDCYAENALVLVVYGNGMAKWGLAFNIHSAGSKMVNFPPGQNKTGTGSQITSNKELASYDPNANPLSPPVAMSPLQMIRYEIAMDPPGSTVAQGGVPSLYRSPTGGRFIDDNNQYLAPITADNVRDGRWQVLARGIEDLQVQYRDGNNVWTDQPPVVTCASPCNAPNAAAYNTGTREVRVTMTVRAEGHNLQGQTTGAVGGAGSRASAVRGNVTTVTSVKALQVYLSEKPPTAACPQCPVWR
jgi:prepilin-type N-terminal cleavage/methylation domain-containing protein